ncbi:MAG: hypothetical protein NZ774_05965 [Candidatus Poseidoniales archaeon]|nr:hypothetical protein [Candidatus Poseidoniales archaeon]
MDGMKRAALLVILLLIPMASFSAEAQGLLPIGVDLECDQQTIDINVHPLQNEPVTISCTVTNTGSFKQNVNLDSSVEGNDFLTELSESSLEMETGDEVDFTVTFTAQPRIEVVSESFNILASIESFGVEPIMVPASALNQSAEVNGEVRSLPYTRLDLTMTDTSSRDIESGEEVSFMFTVFNDGNRVDEVEVSIPNKQEFEDAGFTFVTDSFARAQIQPGSSSDQLTITLKAPSDNSKSISIDIVLSASSQLDSTAEKSELTIKINVGSKGGGSGDGIDLGNFDVSSGDSMATIGMISGGVILVILMLVLMSRLSKRAGTQKTAMKAARKAEKSSRKSGRKGGWKAKFSAEESTESEIEDDLDLDLDELDDLDDDLDFDFDDL